MISVLACISLLIDMSVRIPTHTCVNIHLVIISLDYEYYVNCFLEIIGVYGRVGI